MCSLDGDWLSFQVAKSPVRALGLSEDNEKPGRDRAAGTWGSSLQCANQMKQLPHAASRSCPRALITRSGLLPDRRALNYHAAPRPAQIPPSPRFLLARNRRLWTGIPAHGRRFSPQGQLRVIEVLIIPWNSIRQRALTSSARFRNDTPCTLTAKQARRYLISKKNY